MVVLGVLPQSWGGWMDQCNMQAVLGNLKLSLRIKFAVLTVCSLLLGSGELTLTQAYS